ncbi:MAG: hypothetical protein RR365_14200 [Bacteroides sp.]
MTNEQAIKFISKAIYPCSSCESRDECHRGNEALCDGAMDMAIAALRAQDTPNPPLTLEEVREHIRNGHPNEIAPLYVVFFPTMPIEYASRWRDAYNLSQLITSPCPIYGKTWLAYRRKPEEE